MTDIPTIDFAAHYTGLQEDKERLGQELVTSLRIFGIAKLVNHGVPVPVLQSGFDIVSGSQDHPFTYLMCLRDLRSNRV